MITNPKYSSAPGLKNFVAAPLSPHLRRCSSGATAANHSVLATFGIAKSAFCMECGGKPAPRGRDTALDLPPVVRKTGQVHPTPGPAKAPSPLRFAGALHSSRALPVFWRDSAWSPRVSASAPFMVRRIGSLLSLVPVPPVSCAPRVSRRIVVTPTAVPRNCRRRPAVGLNRSRFAL
jgi:hypothetical protein